MKIENISDFDKEILARIHSNEYEVKIDADGQLMLTTGMYLWDDETIHTEPEPSVAEAIAMRCEHG